MNVACAAKGADHLCETEVIKSLQQADVGVMARVTSRGKPRLFIRSDVRCSRGHGLQEIEEGSLEQNEKKRNIHYTGAEPGSSTMANTTNPASHCSSIHGGSPLGHTAPERRRLLKGSSETGGGADG